MAPMTSTVDWHELKTVRGPLRYLERDGEGPTVVLVHANSSSPRLFERTLGMLGACRVLAPALPGHGEAGAPPPDVSSAWFERRCGIDKLRDDLLDLVRRVGGTSPLVYGHGLGGHVVIQALSAGLEARGVMLGAAPPLHSPEALVRAFGQRSAELLSMPDASLADAMAWVGGICSDRVIGELIARELAATPGAARAALLASADAFRSETDTVANTLTPVGLVTGRDDPMTSLGYLQRLDVPTLWRGAVQVVERCGHFLPLERPRALGELLLEFLADCS